MGADNSDMEECCRQRVKPLTDDPSFLYKKLIRESCARNLYIPVAHKTIQVSHMGNMVDDRGDNLAVAANP